MDHTDHVHQRQQAPLRQAAPGGAIPPTTLLVGSLDGTVALLHARTGVTVWHASTHREVGTLAHDGTQYYVALGSPLRLVQPYPQARELAEQRQGLFERLQTEPAQLEARRARDGHLLWRRADWGLIGRLDVGAEAGGAVVVGSTSVYGDHALHGLDAQTGATRWTYPTTSLMQVNGYRFALRGGRLYGYGLSEAGGMVVLDARAGQPVWDRVWSRDELVVQVLLSPSGQVVVEQSVRLEKTLVRLLDAATGVVGRELALEGGVRAVSDGGVVYCSLHNWDDPGLAAVRLDDGRELWRADGVRIHQLTVTETTVYCARLLAREGVGEVEALEAGSGRRRWLWRTPGDLWALVRLWGARAPWITAAAGVLVGKAVADALTQPSPRQIGYALWREYKWGQWRRPYALHNAVNAMWLAADTRAVYLGTRLGVFALDADNGRLLWHALPTTDVSFLDPALPLD